MCAGLGNEVPNRIPENSQGLSSPPHSVFCYKFYQFYAERGKKEFASHLFCVLLSFHLRNCPVFISGVTAMLWVPPTDSVTSALASVSASRASPVSTANAVRSTTLALDPKAANVRGVDGIELYVSPNPSWDRKSRKNSDSPHLTDG